jgi:hypothetical protein
MIMYLEKRHPSKLAMLLIALIAQYEAINAISSDSFTYLKDFITPLDGASAAAAAVGIAYQVLTTLFPEQTSTAPLTDK